MKYLQPLKMPSDAKKKQQQKNKEAAKARQAGRKAAGSNKTENGLTEKEQSPAPDQPEMNGSGENGTDFSTEGRDVNIFLYWQSQWNS
jgi:ATP-binding cassette subfamily F protein 2